MNETLKWATLLPILIQNHSGNDSVALGVVSPRQYFCGVKSALTKSNRQTNEGGTVQVINQYIFYFDQ